MDGGSTDESVDILKSFGSRVYWESKKDSGQSDAINQGMAMARGEVLAYLNSDDLLQPGAVERAVAYLADHPECDMVYGRAQYIDASGRVTGMYRTDEYSFPRLMQDCCVCQPAAFWRRRIAEKVGPFDVSLQCAMDYDYWLRIDRAGGRIHHIHDILASSRLHGAAKTLTRQRTFYDEIFAVCLKHGGYVDYNYFLGLWHHRLGRQPRRWTAPLGWIPGSHIAPAWVHHKLFEARHKT
jgi:glycosyltransferase involved in cell wall biosynthesis